VNLVMKLAMLELLPPLANATELPILLASLSWAPMLRPNAERRLWFARLPASSQDKSAPIVQLDCR
jgi:hypothetical protein